MDCIGTTNFTIDNTAVYFGCTRLVIRRERHVMKTAVEWEHWLKTRGEEDISRRDVPHLSI